MKHIILFILKLLSKFYAFRLRLKGVRLTNSCKINKMPYIRMTKGSDIILGENVTLTSNPRHNPLLEHAASLRTLTSVARIEFKEHSGMSGSIIACASKVTIGEYTIIGPGTLIYDSDGHDYTPETGWSRRSVRTGRPIHIGRKCYIGTRCIIMGGVTIGDNCVVSAGAVVTKDIPAGHKASGNPAAYVPLPKILGGPGRKIELDK